jgi:sugar phosphate isomerase/epimerase
MKICLGTHALGGYKKTGYWTPSGRVGNSGVSAECRHNLYRWLREHGFDGIEIGSGWWNMYKASAAELVQVRDEMREYGLELVGYNLLRHNLHIPACAESNRADLMHVIEISKAIAPVVIDVSLSLPELEVRGLPNSGISAGKTATDADYEKSAAVLKEAAREAATAGIEIAIELHHCGITDTSARMIRLLDMIDEPNVGANPDLGNLMWGYETPEEPWQQAIENLAGRVKFWHVKNIQLVHVPSVHESFWVHAALGEGDIDYRWALGKLMEKGFDGWISIEDAAAGDFVGFAGRGIKYLRELLDERSRGLGLLVQ